MDFRGMMVTVAFVVGIRRMRNAAGIQWRAERGTGDFHMEIKKNDGTARVIFSHESDKEVYISTFVLLGKRFLSKHSRVNST
jgi:hypothetical protein